MAESEISYFVKDPVSCPVCGAKVYREQMRSGRGRQIAGPLTDELRRHYEESKNYGVAYPLLYTVMVCPECYYAAYQDDFPKPPPEAIALLKSEIETRKSALDGLLTPLNLAGHRTLREGVASFILATMCYEYFDGEYSPLFKCGVSQLRAAWLCTDLHHKEPEENFDHLAMVLYRKARYYYNAAVRGEQEGTQALTGARNLGPDLDKNYGFDGVLYITGLLEYRYGPRSDANVRRKALENAKRTIARIFGMGKASKNKPAAILDNARAAYEGIAKELGMADANPEEEDVE
jgi:uncharacterized protein (DUF2225 family)